MIQCILTHERIKIDFIYYTARLETDIKSIRQSSHFFTCFLELLEGCRMESTRSKKAWQTTVEKETRRKGKYWFELKLEYTLLL